MLGTGFVKRRVLGTYRRLNRIREAILTKVEYLQNESARWKALFTTLKIPYTTLRALGFSPQAAVGLLFVGSTAATGVVVNETILQDLSFGNQSPGVYEAPNLIPVEYTDDNNTLRIDLGATEVGLIEIDSISLGGVYTGGTVPSGELYVISVTGLANANTYLEIGTMTIDRWRCDIFVARNIYANELIIRRNISDGQSVSPTFSAGPEVRPRAVGGGNRAKEMVTSYGDYDLLKIRSPVVNKPGKIDELTLKNIRSTGGACLLDRLRIGTLIIQDSMFGQANGLGAGKKDFVVEDSVVAQSMLIEDNIETVVEKAD